MAAKGKRIQNAWKDLDRESVHGLSEAVKIIKSRATAKFDETIELTMKLSIDVRKADQNIRGMIQLPHGTGKSVRVAVFAKGEKVLDAEKAGADIVGGQDLADKVMAGEINFDRCISTPDMMPIVGKLGKALGPKGLMPNPKLGTVTPDVAKAVEAAKAGQVEYRAEKTGLIQTGVAKASFSEKNIEENILALTNEIFKNRPSSVKGTYVQKVSISSTMGPSVQVLVADLHKTE